MAGRANALDQYFPGLVVGVFARIGNGKDRNLQWHELPAFVDTGHPSHLACESIAGRHSALFQPSHEPALPLRRRAVGESVGHNVTARLLLQAIVADCRRGLHRRLDVARLDRIPALIGIVRPDAGQTVSLQLNTNLDAVGFCLAARRALRILCLRQDAEQVLYVVADLVRYHVSFREIARLASASSETLLDIPEKRGIEINSSVVRAVEWAHCRLSESAATLDRTRIKPQPRHAVLLPALCEYVLPGVLG